MITALALALTLSTTQPPPAEVIAEVRVHGNQVATDAEVLAIAGVKIGDPVSDTTIADVTKRLRDSKHFEDVQVLKRFASIADPTQIVIVIIVDEGPVRLENPKAAGDPIRIVKRGGIGNLMWLPILEGEDGYGATAGVRLALVDVTGDGGRLSFPLTWGGTRQAGVEFDRTFTGGPFSRVTMGTAIERRKNPAFDINDDRRRIWGRLERAVGHVRAGATAGWQHASFDAIRDDYRSVGADVTLDTRLDPVLPRNAILATSSWERLSFTPESTTAGAINRLHLQGNGYVGLVGQTVLELSAVKDDADRALPPYLKSLLGGWSNLRGFQAGAFNGDTLVAASVGLRIPLTSALSVGKIGVTVFVDSGKAYDKGQRFSDTPFRTGVGGSVWLSAAVFQLSFSVAHGRGADTRVNFGGGLMF